MRLHADGIDLVVYDARCERHHRRLITCLLRLANKGRGITSQCCH